MKVEVIGEVEEFERERWIFWFDAGYLRMTLREYFHEVRSSDVDQWETKSTIRPATLPDWVVVEARTNLAQRIDVLK